jgi:two-component system sensor histidine kinase HydH
VSVHDVVAEALNVAKYYKGSRQRRIEADHAADVPPVLGRHDLLVQVVLNLLLNAIDATEKDGRIAIRSAARDGQVELTLQDDGCGMTPEQAERIFQPYFTTKKNGTGLGLYVTRKLVTEHGGGIDFTTTPGAGTTFTVRLPGAAYPANGQRALTAMLPPATNGGMGRTSLDAK